MIGQTTIHDEYTQDVERMNRCNGHDIGVRRILFGDLHETSYSGAEDRCIRLVGLGTDESEYCVADTCAASGNAELGARLRDRVEESSNPLLWQGSDVSRLTSNDS